MYTASFESVDHAAERFDNALERSETYPART
jgi:hypothetical protein